MENATNTIKFYLFFQLRPKIRKIRNHAKSKGRSTNGPYYGSRAPTGPHGPSRVSSGPHGDPQKDGIPKGSYVPAR